MIRNELGVNTIVITQDIRQLLSEYVHTVTTSQWISSHIHWGGRPLSLLCISKLCNRMYTHVSFYFSTVVEFYVLDTATAEAYLASYVVDKLDKSSVFKKLNSEFSIMGIETKGDTIMY